ncbi:MAG TPA: hypothetical protein VG537_04100 [Candidatus Kapabacteria bacterium]|jgi:LPS O-antigen subunit length determinant protein (WzzB/FepE family)|nr:hypothetical protein [Candidatus Kapabacteria bacterium]
MEEIPPVTPSGPETHVPDLPPDPHIMDYFVLLARYKWGVLLTFFLSTFLLLLATYFVPCSFTAESLILPPDRASSAGLLAAQDAAGALKIMKESENPSIDLLQNILESRTMATMLARDSAIGRYYRAHTDEDENMMDAIHDAFVVYPFISKVSIAATVSTGWFSNPKEKAEAQTLSAYLLNLAVHNMDSIFSSDFQSNARLQYRYADSDYLARKTELDSIDAEQAQFESAHGAVALKEQTTAAIEQVSRLQALHDSSEIAANLLRMDFSEQNPGTQTAEMMANQAEQAANSYITEARIGPSLIDLPELSKEYAEILRSKKSLEPIVSYLRQEVEQQRINQERQRTLVILLDSAKVPDHKSSPKRAPMIPLGFTLGAVLSVSYAALRSFLSSWKMERMRRGPISLIVSEAEAV